MATPAQLSSWALQAGIVSRKRRTIAVAVALAESGGNERAHNLSSIEDSRGPWQINVRAHPTWAHLNLYSGRVNALAMAQISALGLNWEPWTTYTSGAYLQHMDTAAAATGAKSTDAQAMGFLETPDAPLPGHESIVSKIVGPFVPYFKIMGGGVLLLAGLGVVIAGVTGSSNKAQTLALAYMTRGKSIVGGA